MEQIDTRHSHSSIQEISYINLRCIHEDYFVVCAKVKLRGRTLDVLYGIFKASWTMHNHKDVVTPPLFTF